MKYLPSIVTGNTPLIKSVWLLSLLSIVCCNDLWAQPLLDTTLIIPEVIISASRNDHFRRDIKTEEFSKAELKDYSGQSLYRLLSEKTSLNIKAIGVGGSASSISLRGASSSQVQVNWNGFPVNSVTHGSADLSMIPAAGFERISVVYGASGALYGSGTFGGAIRLDNDMQTDKALSGGAYLSWQSLKTLNSGLSFHVGNEKIAWKISAWGSVSKNEFKYYDYIRQSERKQTDGPWNDYGMIQNLVIKLSPSSSVESGLWCQAKSLDIPSRIGSTTYEHQSDSTLKIYLGYKHIRNRWSLKIKTARLADVQNYRQRASAQSSVNSIESRIASSQYYGDVNLRYYLSPGFSVDAGLVGSLITADVSAYGEKKKEKGIAAMAGVKYSFERLTLQAALRKEWNSSFSSSLLPAFGLAWETIPEKLEIRANYSRKFRRPTFNDLFWMPGGNSNLNPEKGYTLETGSEVRLWSDENSQISADAGFYYSHIADMIVWRPAGAFWEAQNYNNVTSYGVEAKFEGEIKREKWSATSVFSVSLNHSENATSGEWDPMLYSPLIITSWENSVTAGIFNLTLKHHFTSDRFYSEERRLDSFNLFDASAGAKISAGKGKFGIHAVVNNLTNTAYELVRLYPMPGRYYSLKLDYTFYY